MNTILIKNITLIDGSQKDILISNGKFDRIAANIADKAEITIDGKDKTIIPAFYNAHTHAAMALLRSYSEGKSLQSWLNEVWKKEATLTNEDIFNGSRLAILEMIRSGTVFFADMYWKHKSVIAAVKDMGVRANVGITFMDTLDSKTCEENMEFIKSFANDDKMISLSVSPHAIYTCSERMYEKCYEIAHSNGLNLHTHLCETQKEVADCISKYGISPVELLDKLGVLDKHTIAAHCVHITPSNADILATREVNVVHNPCSNMKLASGVFPYRLCKTAGINIALGTDGAASNNSLSMLQEMKFASLLAKVSTDNPTSLPAQEVFQWATTNSATAFGLKAGVIAEGYDADCLLVDMNHVSLVPNNDIVSSLVYAADNECINTVICNGKVLMQNRIIEKEEEIIAKAKKFIK
ncbi:MAG: amidohydrolase [Bacteroidales bacterium]|jgi:5-methylthioadenosine/S-adenosylhomocysteine deaminase|nr:amidohydrolase [Bacteroidales bacterium]